MGTLFERVNEFQATHARHLQIGDDGVEAFAVEQLQRFDRAGQAVDLMAGVPQHVGDRLAGLAVIVDDQHAAVAAAAWWRQRQSGRQRDWAWETLVNDAMFRGSCDVMCEECEA